MVATNPAPSPASSPEPKRFSLKTGNLTQKGRLLAVGFWLVTILLLLALVSLLFDGYDGLEKYAQLTVSGLAVGSIYALLALGFVVVYKATGIFNLAQTSLVVLGVYLLLQLYEKRQWNFVLALLASLAAMAIIGAVIERAVMRRMLGKPVFNSIMVTLALLIVIDQLTRAIWSGPGDSLIIPYSQGSWRLGGVSVGYVDVWALASALVLLVLFFIFFERTRMGLAMRATALDAEVASAQGVRIGVAYALSWAIAGVVATVAGAIYISGSGGALTPSFGFVALRAFPAMILGGLDSTSGAVVGGIIIGLAEELVSGYADFAWLGSSFEKVVPYVLLVPTLLWRPQGLFGTKKVERS